MSRQLSPTRPTVGSGVHELDEILSGGLTPDRVYLVEGNPGAGKTTLALQFLLEGVRQGERGLYVTLSETADELAAVAHSHGWSLDGLSIHELVDPAQGLEAEAQYTMFQPSEVEMGEMTRAVLEKVESENPRRVVFDSLSEMRLLAQTPLRYRRQILGLKQFFVGRDCTVLLLDDKSSFHEDLQLQSIAHGVISLEQMLPEYGSERRRLRIIKMRGIDFDGGYHDFAIRRGGLQVYPRAVVAATGGAIGDRLDSGNPQVDVLVGGGLERGSSVLMVGPAGVGKSSLATLYALSAAKRGERAALFVFDETSERLLQRSAGMGMDLAPHIESGGIVLEQVNPGEISPGEFADRVRRATVEDPAGRRASVVLIDSLNGYLNSMPEERFLSMQLHELLTYLESRGIVTFLVVAQHGLLGSGVGAPVDASYLADVVVLFRYFETGGEVRQAISVVKKRGGSHERTIREFRLSADGVRVGEPLRDFRGVLSGVPTYFGDDGDLLRRRDG